MMLNMLGDGLYCLILSSCSLGMVCIHEMPEYHRVFTFGKRLDAVGKKKVHLMDFPSKDLVLL